ncbi:MAG: histidine phosphatase family protein [Saprospiraceae bacterium]
MKYTYIIILALSVFCVSCKTELGDATGITNGKVIFSTGNSTEIKDFDNPNALTFFVVRHAEKVDESEDPPLSEVGIKRANQLAKILKDVPITLALSTNYLRTTQTANPIVTRMVKSDIKCDIGIYNPNDLDFRFGDLLQKRKGEKILVIGHSNTVPDLLNYFTGKEVYNDIPPNEYGNFYVVTYRGKGDADVMELKY